MTQQPHYYAEARKIVAEGLPIGPRMFPCACGQGRHAHAGKNATGGCKTTGCKRYRPNMAWELAYQAVDAQAATLGTSLRRADRLMRQKVLSKRPRSGWSVRISDTGTCPKAIEYRNKPPADFVAAPEDKRPATAGTMLHEGITARMRLIYPWRQYAGKVTIDGLDGEYEFDSFDPIVAEVIDWKTAGRWKWDQVGEFGPAEDVWEQIALYGLALEDMGYEVRTLRAAYYARENGHDESFVRPYDRKVAEAARDRLIGYATSLDLGIELPRAGTGPNHDGICRGCFARIHCWNMDKAEVLGRSPESVTILGESPDLDDIIWAIEEKVAAAKAETEAKHASSRAKGLLDGIEPGRYGDYVGRPQPIPNAGQPDHKADAAHLREILDLPDEMRPRADTIPVPLTPQRFYIKWSRVRQATLDKEARDRAGLDKAAS